MVIIASSSLGTVRSIFNRCSAANLNFNSISMSSLSCDFRRKFGLLFIVFLELSTENRVLNFANLHFYKMFFWSLLSLRKCDAYCSTILPIYEKFIPAQNQPKTAELYSLLPSPSYNSVSIALLSARSDRGWRWVHHVSQIADRGPRIHHLSWLFFHGTAEGISFKCFFTCFLSVWVTLKLLSDDQLHCNLLSTIKFSHFEKINS